MQEKCEKKRSEERFFRCLTLFEDRLSFQKESDKRKEAKEN